MKNSLVKIPWSIRSRLFSYHKVIGTLGVESLPSEFIIPKLFGITDQGQKPKCFAEAFCSASEDQEGVKLSSDWQAALTWWLLNGYNPNGADLGTVCSSGVKYGSAEESQITVPTDWSDWQSYSILDKLKGEAHKKKCYLKVDGPNDLFDNIRSVIYSQKRVVITGCKWSPMWWYISSGVVPKGEPIQGGGHAFVWRGWKQINGEPYLIAQLSNGLLGNNGYYYFSREDVNKRATFGNLVLVDLSIEEARQSSWNMYQKMINYLIKIIRELTNKKMTIAELAQSKLNTDFTDDKKVPDMVSCAFATSTIIHEFDARVPIIYGTAEWDKYLSTSPLFERVKEPVTEIKAGDIVVSPTPKNGEWGNDEVEIGHTGIYLNSTEIASNDSFTGKFILNYTRETWRKRWGKAGFPIRIYRYK